jgi:phosphatidylserine/phosphatidylglycerophosphate/cardiolipin synthase-like enzyme
MNFDQRLLDINTEIGIIIDSPQIARAMLSVLPIDNLLQEPVESSPTGSQDRFTP